MKSSGRRESREVGQREAGGKTLYREEGEAGADGRAQEEGESREGGQREAGGKT